MMLNKQNLLCSTFYAGAALAILTIAGPVPAAGQETGQEWDSSCPVSYSSLKKALVSADQANAKLPTGSGGLKNHFWAVVVNRAGVVCAVAFSGPNTGSQWLASRQIAAAKAFTANGLSLNIPTPSGIAALSTAQLYQFVQPSNKDIVNPLFGLEGGNVLNSELAYRGDYASFGTPNDPMIGQRIGGTITFGGGLGLYKGGNTIVGGLGLSGDTACADHSVAWQTRINLMLAPNPATDLLTFATNTAETNGHPHCPNDAGTLGSKIITLKSASVGRPTHKANLDQSLNQHPFHLVERYFFSAAVVKLRRGSPSARPSQARRRALSASGDA